MKTPTDDPWRIKMLFDGQCPLCSREVALLRKRNAKGLMAFEDIADPAFDAGQYGLTLDALIGSMHGVRPDGSIVRGIDVFAEVYEAAGWSWMAFRFAGGSRGRFADGFIACLPRFDPDSPLLELIRAASGVDYPAGKREIRFFPSPHIGFG